MFNDNSTSMQQTARYDLLLWQDSRKIHCICECVGSIKLKLPKRGESLAAPSIKRSCVAHRFWGSISPIIAIVWAVKRIRLAAMYLFTARIEPVTCPSVAGLHTLWGKIVIVATSTVAGKGTDPRCIAVAGCHFGVCMASTHHVDNKENQ